MTRDRTVRVQFVHGLEGSPQGTKARLLDEAFAASTPEMPTEDFARCVEIQAETLAVFGPDVLVGSSFGGAVALALLQQGLWRGPTLLLAQAAAHYELPLELPEGVRVWIVHGERDELVDPEESRTLARSGSPDLVRLIEVDDDHPLSAFARDGTLVETVRALVKEELSGG